MKTVDPAEVASIFRFSVTTLFKLQSSLERGGGGGGDHEELTILLKNRLIPSRFNQELLYTGGRTPLYRKFSTKNVGRLIRRRRIDGRDCAIVVGHDPTIP